MCIFPLRSLSYCHFLFLIFKSYNTLACSLVQKHTLFFLFFFLRVWAVPEGSLLKLVNIVHKFGDPWRKMVRIAHKALWRENGIIFWGATCRSEKWVMLPVFANRVTQNAPYASKEKSFMNILLFLVASREEKVDCTEMKRVCISRSFSPKWLLHVWLFSFCMLHWKKRQKHIFTCGLEKKKSRSAVCHFTWNNIIYSRLAVALFVTTCM